MSTFPCSIECLPGDVHVWGDLLSRWGSAPSAPPVAHVRKLLHVVSPSAARLFRLADCCVDFVRPNVIFGRGETIPPGVAWSEEDSYYMDPDGRIWVQDGAVDLQQRLCVIAHQGAAGHRRIATTTKSVSDVFIWTTLAQDVDTFVRACLQCLQVDGDVVPRPLGSALHAEKPNELIHFDWLSMPES
ncbi:hypothetical protein H310_10573 [Aphanomyces invadans]|uniref:Integrase zinc-binding domain-containing protein n=1 Tax=Aphanomyces invadans TaxID=157072 RepID=A0A024TPI7_9STRA|nr:hypothetical protein H310_10573 [Aphanomyces invadans]ETV95908.1 hypothetical protein H310_10573 [Aphanomyces invadans]|eukprot:XP_008875219.1 hypothetical protein H310_10573 [Aphanomyces invadans]